LYNKNFFFNSIVDATKKAALFELYALFIKSKY